MKRAFSAFYGILAISSFALSSDISSAQTSNRYAYVFNEQNSDTVVVKTVDPDNPTTAEDFLTLSIPANYVLVDSTASPNGEWLVLVMSLGTEYLIRLVNVNGSETHDITGMILAPFPESSLIESYHHVVWSADSSRFAFNVIRQGDGRDTYVYTLSTNSPVNLTSDSRKQYEFVWSSDSTRLAIASGDCPTPLTCRAMIDLYDVINITRQASIDISSAAVGIGDLGEATLCRLAWSQDGQYISFMSSCDATSDIFKETYLVNAVQGTVLPITDFTTQVKSPDPFAHIFANYAPIWHDAQTLLVGVVFANPDSQGTQTFVYSLPRGSTTILSTEMAQEWAINSISRELAFRSFSISPPSTEPQNAAVKIATLTGTTLNTLSSNKAGCDLVWSPDGATLAYTHRGLPFINCRYPILRILFVNKANGQLTEHILNSSEATTPGITLPIGWVVIQTPPPTATETPAATARPIDSEH